MIVKTGSASDAKSVALRDLHPMLYGPNPIPKSRASAESSTTKAGSTWTPGRR